MRNDWKDKGLGKDYLYTFYIQILLDLERYKTFLIQPRDFESKSLASSIYKIVKGLPNDSKANYNDFKALKTKEEYYTLINSPSSVF